MAFSSTGRLFDRGFEDTFGHSDVWTPVVWADNRPFRCAAGAVKITPKLLNAAISPILSAR
jgi:hypothetical protein